MTYKCARCGMILRDGEWPPPIAACPCGGTPIPQELDPRVKVASAPKPKKRDLRIATSSAPSAWLAPPLPDELRPEIERLVTCAGGCAKMRLTHYRPDLVGCVCPVCDWVTCIKCGAAVGERAVARLSICDECFDTLLTESGHEATATYRLVAALKSQKRRKVKRYGN